MSHFFKTFFSNFDNASNYQVFKNTLNLLLFVLYPTHVEHDLYFRSNPETDIFIKFMANNLFVVSYPTNVRSYTYL